MVKTYSKKPLAYKKRPMRKTSSVKKVSLAVKKYVKRSLNSAIEDKFDVQHDTSLISNVLSGTAPYFHNLNCQTLQGVGQGSRIGNRQHVKSAVMRASFNMNYFNTFTNSRCLDQLVTIVVFKLKNYSTGSNPTDANFFSKMFQYGSSSIGLTNTPLDHLRKLNTDLMDVKFRKTFKMGYSLSSTAIGGITVGPGTSPVPNNDFKYHQFVTIPLTKFYKKIQIYNDSVNNDAGNDNLFFMVYLAPADGDAFTSTPLKITWDWNLTYEDA